MDTEGGADGVDGGGGANGSGMANGSTSPAGEANGSGSDGAAIVALPRPLTVPRVNEVSQEGARFKSGRAEGDDKGEATDDKQTVNACLDKQI